MKSGRVIKETAPFHRSFGLVAWKTLMDQDEQDKFPSAVTQYKLQKKMDHPFAFAATTNPDILYAHKAMKAPDRQKFIGNVVPVKKEDIPPGNKLIDIVWSMRRKRRINTQEICKWKVRLNVHGGQQEYGIHYWETYDPVVTWQTLRIFMILSLIQGWASCQLDFVMAYPQAPVEKPLYMRLPQGYHHKGITRTPMSSSSSGISMAKSKLEEFGTSIWMKA